MSLVRLQENLNDLNRGVETIMSNQSSSVLQVQAAFKTFRENLNATFTQMAADSEALELTVVTHIQQDQQHVLMLQIGYTSNG